MGDVIFGLIFLLGVVAPTIGGIVGISKSSHEDAIEGIAYLIMAGVWLCALMLISIARVLAESL